MIADTFLQLHEECRSGAASCATAVSPAQQLPARGCPEPRASLAPAWPELGQGLQDRVDGTGLTAQGLADGTGLTGPARAVPSVCPHTHLSTDTHTHTHTLPLQ